MTGGKTSLPLLILLLLLPVSSIILRAGEEGTPAVESKIDLDLMLGPSLPLGSLEFNKDSFFGISVRAIANRQLGGPRPKLSAELETGADLMAGWYDGAILSIPVFINAHRSWFHSRNGRCSTYFFGGIGGHYHQVIFEIGGVEAVPQLRPSVQMGMGLKRSITRRWVLNLRSTYLRSFTTKQVARFAGITIQSRDRYGYGSILLSVGISRKK
jgi:hypothetical protein